MKNWMSYRNTIMLQWLFVVVPYFSLILFAFTAFDIFVYLIYTLIVLFILITIYQIYSNFEDIKKNLRKYLINFIIKLIILGLLYPTIILSALFMLGSSEY